MLSTIPAITPVTAAQVETVDQGRRLSAAVIYPTGPVRARPLVALHGISRETKAMITAFTQEAEAAGCIVIVPHFTKDAWPVFQRITKRHRADRALLTLFADLRMRNVIGAGRLDLFGYSGGAQLAHRFTMLHPEHVADLHLGAAGWYTLPDPSLAYPIGLGPSLSGDDCWGRRMTSGLAAYLNRRITLYVGSANSDPNDRALRRKPELDIAQGTTRLERAHCYARTISRMQIQLGLPETCALYELTGCHHSFKDCARNGDLAALAARPEHTN